MSQGSKMDVEEEIEPEIEPEIVPEMEVIKDTDIEESNKNLIL